MTYVIGNGTYDYAHGNNCPGYGWHVAAPAVPACKCNGMYSRGYDDGYGDALNDARGAVSAVDEGPKDRPYWIDRQAALASIDALSPALLAASQEPAYQSEDPK